jgi:hypothetical protein
MSPKIGTLEMQFIELFTVYFENHVKHEYILQVQWRGDDVENE